MHWYTIGFWRKPEKAGISFDEIARRSYDTITIFNDLQDEYQPNYQRVWCKKDAVPFNWSYENFYEKLKKNVNKSGKTIFEELGYSISFFSCLDDKKSTGYSLRVGNQNELFKNALIVDLPILFDLKNERNAALICDIFQKIIVEFEPFWAGALCNSNIAKQGKSGFPEGGDNHLTGVHWLNYWSCEIVSSIGEDKLATISDVFPRAKFSDGFLRLQETPLFLECEVDRQYKRSVEKYLIK